MVSTQNKQTIGVSPIFYRLCSRSATISLSYVYYSVTAL
jgi:hypothetical protein